jgi:hypothetical protein
VSAGWTARTIVRVIRHDLIVVPLPNEGGVFPIMMKSDNTYVTSPEFEKIYEEMLEIDDLALVIIDPMASFVHADVNSDPAAGAAFMGLLAQMATETGATVMVNHHMAKIRDKEPVTTPEQARNLIRGTSAIVDGVRSAFAIWQVDEGVAEARCRDLGIKYQRNMVYDGAVVKSNGVANREIRRFVRNANTGLLEDRTVDMNSAKSSSTPRVQERREVIYRWIVEREDMGLPLTKSGKKNGILHHAHNQPEMDTEAQEIKKQSRQTIEKDVDNLIGDGRVKQFKRTKGGAVEWLGVVNGRLRREEEELGLD